VLLHGSVAQIELYFFYSKLSDRFPSKELRERGRLGTDDITLALQQNRLQWHGHVFQKVMTVKNCTEYEAKGPRPRGRPKRTLTEVVERTVKHVN